MVCKPLARFSKSPRPPKCSCFRHTTMRRMSKRRSTPARWVIWSNNPPLAMCASRFGKSKRGTHFSARPFPGIFGNGMVKSRWIEVECVLFANPGDMSDGRERFSCQIGAAPKVQHHGSSHACPELINRAGVNEELSKTDEFDESSPFRPPQSRSRPTSDEIGRAHV